MNENTADGNKMAYFPIGPGVVMLHNIIPILFAMYILRYAWPYIVNKKIRTSKSFPPAKM